MELICQSSVIGSFSQLSNDSRNVQCLKKSKTED